VILLFLADLSSTFEVLMQEIHDNMMILKIIYMAELALYRKYRPTNFSHLVGQDHVRTTILNALKESHVSHAYLFCGPRGTGKTTTARLISKAVNCTNPTEEKEPCEKCDMCVSTAEGKLIDLIEIDAASNRGIDEIRDLKEKIHFAPTRAVHKIYIIDEVHMLTKEAFNALLKTLEEPPSHTFFILCTTEIHKVPETIISRCQRFDFKRVDMKAMMARLSFIAQSEGTDAEDSAIEAICKHVDGGLRDAIGLLDQLTVGGKLTFENVRAILGISDLKTIEGLYSSLMNNDAHGGLSLVQTLHTDGIDFAQFTREFLEYLRNLLLDKVSNNEKDEIGGLLKLITLFQEALVSVKTSSIPQLPLEIAIVKFCHGEPVVTDVPKVLSKKVKEKKAPEVAETSEREHKAVKESAPLQSEEKIPLTISHLKENWPRVLEQIAVPAVKRSALEGSPAKVEGHDVTLEFTSKFHLEKVLNQEARVDTEKAFEKVFGEKVKVLGNLKDVELSSKSSDIASDAVEIFGGELIEE
jgi:DNA polymerase III subunit gamma/tau